MVLFVENTNAKAKDKEEKMIGVKEEIARSPPTSREQYGIYAIYRLVRGEGYSKNRLCFFE